MSIYCPSHKFLDNSDLSRLEGKQMFDNSYLSVNVPISQSPDIFSYVQDEREKFREFEPEILELYKDQSLHFTLGAAVQLPNDPKVARVKKIVESRKEEVLKIVGEEISKLRPFKVSAKFTKATPKSIFVFVSFEKEMEKSITTF